MKFLLGALLRSSFTRLSVRSDSVFVLCFTTFIRVFLFFPFVLCVCQ